MTDRHPGEGEEGARSSALASEVGTQTGTSVSPMTRDWQEWHRAYDDPTSSLSQRLRVVTAMVRTHLDEAPAGPIRVLSLCAGEGRDIADASRGHHRAGDLSGLLLEHDPALAERATANVRSAADGLQVRRTDAGNTENFCDMEPVDLLLLVGIFGNISDDDVRETITAVPAMCRSGATILWTRHRREPDLTPLIREWFDAVGCRSRAFVSEVPGRFTVGAEILATPGDASVIPPVLFTFRDDLW